MKKLCAFLMIGISIIFWCAPALGSYSEIDTLNSVYQWKAMSFGRYEMIENKYTGVLHLHVWTIARYIEECAERLRLAEPAQPGTFEFTSEDREKFSIGTINDESVQSVLDNDPTSMLIAYKLNLVKLHIEKEIIKAEMLAALYETEYIDSYWFMDIMMVLRKAQVTLDYSLYLEENKDMFNKFWME